ESRPGSYERRVLFKKRADLIHSRSFADQPEDLRVRVLAGDGQQRGDQQAHREEQSPSRLPTWVRRPSSSAVSGASGPTRNHALPSWIRMSVIQTGRAPSERPR